MKVLNRSLPRFESIQEYDEMRLKLDVEVFKGVAFQIAERHHLPKERLQLFPDGTNVIFSYGPSRVIKLFQPLLKGQFESERLVLKNLQSKLSVPTPVPEFQGEFDGWPYLIMSKVEGETLESIWVDLEFENKVTLMREIGLLIREVHS